MGLFSLDCSGAIYQGSDSVILIYSVVDLVLPS